MEFIQLERMCLYYMRLCLYVCICMYMRWAEMRLDAW